MPTAILSTLFRSLLKMFTKSELDLFNNPKGKMNEWMELLVRFEDHKLACNAYGIVGAGVYRTHK